MLGLSRLLKIGSTLSMPASMSSMKRMRPTWTPTMSRLAAQSLSTRNAIDTDDEREEFGFQHYSQQPWFEEMSEEDQKEWIWENEVSWDEKLKFGTKEKFFEAGEAHIKECK